MSPILGARGGLSASAYGLFAPSLALNSYESIQTVTVGSGGQATVDFTSIPNTYKHLQIRVLCRSETAFTNDGILMRVGTGGTLDTTSTLWGHFLKGDGASATAGSRSSTNIEMIQSSGATSTAGVFGVAVIDLLDYQNTNKNKTFRSLTGVDQNGSTGEIRLMSGSYGANTNAIDTIRFYSAFANISQYSSFALYGIKG
jgi:hypothetical protein